MYRRRSLLSLIALILGVLLFCNFITNTFVWALMPNGTEIPGWAPFVCGPETTMLVESGTNQRQEITKNYYCQHAGPQTKVDSIRFTAVILVATSAIVLAGALLLLMLRIAYGQFLLGAERVQTRCPTCSTTLAVSTAAMQPVCPRCGERISMPAGSREQRYLSGTVYWLVGFVALVLLANVLALVVGLRPL